MQTPSTQYAEKAGFTPQGLPPAAPILTVEQFAARNPAFTAAALRNLIFKAEARQSSRGVLPGNGLAECGAILRIGRKVLIDEARFFEWLRTGGVKKGAA